MSSSLESSLYRVASSTFEELGFMLPDREPSERQLEAALDGEVSVSFQGPFDGCVRLRVFGGVLPTLAMNMLGESELPAEALQRDALGEVANVICGNVLPAIAGSTEVFRLDAPRSGLPACRACSLGERVSVVVLGLDGGRAELSLYTTAPLTRALEPA